MSSTVSLTSVGLTTAQLAEELAISRAPSDLVAIDRERLARLADHIRTSFSVPAHSRARWDDPLFWNVEAGRPERSQFFAVGCAINFRFWQLQADRFIPATGTIDGAPYRGAMYMWRCLRRASAGGPIDILDASSLADITREVFDAIFTDDHGVNPLAVAAEDRIANLRDLGVRLREDWGGQFLNLVEASNRSLAHFARACSHIRAFDDPVHKLTMVNAIVHLGSGVYDFADEPLPAIDYHLLRHALRQGLLKPSPLLRTKLVDMCPLTNNEAHELRRVALTAFVDLAAASGVSGELLDNRYWLNRTNCADVPVCLDPEQASACPFLAACQRITEFPIPIDSTRYY